MNNTTPCQPIGNDDGQIVSTKKCSKCGEEKPLTEYTKRSKSTDGLSYTCRPCAKAIYTKYHQERGRALRVSQREADPEGYAERKREQYRRRLPKHKAWVEANKARSLLVKRAWKGGFSEPQAREHQDKANEQMRRWREKNAEHVRQWREDWNLKNRDKVCLYTNRRNFKHRTPPWADIGAIAEVYALAKALSDSTGVPHDVDHIYPLRGRKVSGLNVQGNLRPMPSQLNNEKHNRLPGSEAQELWNPGGRDVYYPKDSECLTT